MKKTISSLIILLIFLVPALGNASYLIRLKNGGQLATPGYWFEGKLIFFYISGGTAGMERSEIDRIERDETDYSLGMVRGDIGEKAPPPSPKTEQPQESGKTQQTAEPATEVEEKVNIEAYRSKKDGMTLELDRLLAKQREAAGRGDNKAKEKIMEEIRNTSSQIYKITDEVKEKNEGKLPDGWWKK